MVSLPMNTSELFEGEVELPKIDDESETNLKFKQMSATRPIPDRMEIVAKEDGQMTFIEAVHCFNLPRSAVLTLNTKKSSGAGGGGNRSAKTKNVAPSRFKDYKDIEVVEVSGFRGRGVS